MELVEIHLTALVIPPTISLSLTTHALVNLHKHLHILKNHGHISQSATQCRDKIPITMQVEDQSLRRARTFKVNETLPELA